MQVRVKNNKFAPIKLTQIAFSTLLLTTLIHGCSLAQKDTAADSKTVSHDQAPIPEVNTASEDQHLEHATTTDQQTQTTPTYQQDDVIRLHKDAPSHYRVKKGDTLWDISAKFLQNPWVWPELWYFNPQISNPHLIYPGDELIMSYIDGKPRLHRKTVTPTAVQSTTKSGTHTPYNSDRVVKLKPKVRPVSLEDAIPPVSLNVIRSFLSSSRVLDKTTGLPHIVGALDNRIVSGLNQTIYVANMPTNPTDTRFQILRPGREFKDPITDELLGYEALEVGMAKLRKLGTNNELSTFVITKNNREVLRGDLLVPSNSEDILFNFYPSQPSTDVKGQVIGLHDAIANAATNQVIIISAGSREGVQPGNILAVDQKGAIVRESIAGTHRKQSIQLPPVNAGLVLVFKVFHRVSYALIVSSERAIHINDIVRSPVTGKGS